MAESNISNTFFQPRKLSKTYFKIFIRASKTIFVFNLNGQNDDLSTFGTPIMQLLSSLDNPACAGLYWISIYTFLHRCLIDTYIILLQILVVDYYSFPLFQVFLLVGNAHYNSHPFTGLSLRNHQATRLLPPQSNYKISEQVSRLKPINQRKKLMNPKILDITVLPGIYHSSGYPKSYKLWLWWPKRRASAGIRSRPPL